jgi:hypothetical protein
MKYETLFSSGFWPWHKCWIIRETIKENAEELFCDRSGTAAAANTVNSLQTE